MVTEWKDLCKEMEEKYKIKQWAKEHNCDKDDTFWQLIFDLIQEINNAQNNY